MIKQYLLSYYRSNLYLMCIIATQKTFCSVLSALKLITIKNKKTIKILKNCIEYDTLKHHKKPQLKYL